MRYDPDSDNDELKRLLWWWQFHWCMGGRPRVADRRQHLIAR